MPKIDTEAERERLDRIFDEIAGKMPEEPKKTQKEIDYENRCAGLAKEHDNHHYYKVFADYVRKHLEKL